MEEKKNKIIDNYDINYIIIQERIKDNINDNMNNNMNNNINDNNAKTGGKSINSDNDNTKTDNKSINNYNNNEFFIKFKFSDCCKTILMSNERISDLVF